MNKVYLTDKELNDLLRDKRQECETMRKLIQTIKQSAMEVSYESKESLSNFLDLVILKTKGW
jgi:hypothetical protein